MAITLESQQRLERVNLTGFFAESEDDWCAMAQQSLEFVARNFPKSSIIHPDDVSKALLTLVEVSEPLSQYLGENKLKQKYWLTDFCDLIVDQCWDNLRVPPGLPGKTRKR